MKLAIVWLLAAGSLGAAGSWTLKSGPVGYQRGRRAAQDPLVHAYSR